MRPNEQVLEEWRRARGGGARAGYVRPSAEAINRWRTGGVFSAPADPVRESDLFRDQIQDEDWRESMRDLRGYWNPPMWRRALEVLTIGQQPLTLGREAIERHLKMAREGVMPETIAVPDNNRARLYDLLERPLVHLLNWTVGRIERPYTGAITEFYDKHRALGALRRVAFGTVEASSNIMGAMPEFLRQELYALKQRATGNYTEADRPVILPNAPITHYYEPRFANRRFMDWNATPARIVGPAQTLMDEVGIHNMAARTAIVALTGEIPNAIARWVMTAPLGEVTGLGLDIAMDPIGLLLPEAHPVTAGVRAGLKGLKGAVGLPEHVAATILDRRLARMAATGERVEETFAGRAALSVLRSNRATRDLLMRQMHIAGSEESHAVRLFMDQLDLERVKLENWQIAQKADAIVDTRNIIKTGIDTHLAATLPHGYNMEDVLKAIYRAEGRPYSRTLGHYLTFGGTTRGAATAEIENLLGRVNEAAWDDLSAWGQSTFGDSWHTWMGRDIKTWRDALPAASGIDPVVVKRMVDTARDHFLDTHLTDMVERVHGPGMRRIVEDVGARWARYQGENAARMVSANLMGGVHADVFAPIHNFRGFMWHLEPDEMLHILETSNPYQAAILKSELERAGRPVSWADLRGRGASHPDVLKARKTLDDSTKRMLGQMDFEEAAELEARAVGRRLASYNTVRRVTEAGPSPKPTAMMPAGLRMGTSDYGRWVRGGYEEWVLEGMDPARLVDPATGVARTPGEFLTDLMTKNHGESWATVRTRTLAELGGDTRLERQIFERHYTNEFRAMTFPNHPMYPTLGGTLVSRDMANYLVNMDRGAGPVARKVAELMGKWRYGKACMNVGGQLRNIASNIIQIATSTGLRFNWTDLREGMLAGTRAERAMIDLSDVTADRLAGISRSDAASTRMLVRTVRDVGAPAEVAEALKDVASIPGRIFSASEILMREPIYKVYFRRFADRFEKAGRVTGLTDVHGGLTREWIEMASRMKRSTMIDTGRADVLRAGAYTEREIAASVAAERLANDAVVKYNSIPPLVETMRGYGVYPFIAFPYRAVPVAMRMALEHPGRFANLERVFRFIEDFDHKAAETQAAMSENQRGGMYLRIPGALYGREGQDVVMNMSYIMPWGDLWDTSGAYAASSAVEAQAKDVMLNMPFVAFLSELATGRNTLTGRQFIQNSDPKEVRIQKHIANFWKTIMPPMLFGSQSTMEFIQAWTKQWAKTQGKRKVPTLVGDELKEMSPANAMLHAAGEWLNRLATQKDAPWREMFMPAQSTPSLSTAVMRAFGLRALPFQQPEAVEKVHKQIEFKAKDLKAALNRLDKAYDEGLIPGGEDEYLRRRYELEQTFNNWWENHPYTQYQRYYNQVPTWGEQFWVEADMRKYERRSTD